MAEREDAELAPVFLTARWCDVAMLNYEVEPSLLARRVPRGTELDLWRGTAFVSIVGFRFLDCRVAGIPIPFHRDFEEVNLRFYVRRGDRRGVVFIKELVPRAAIAWVARLLYNENYDSLAMRHEVETGRRVRYEWRLAKRWEGLEVRLEGEPRSFAQDTEESFISEHYYGYASQRDGSTLEYRVEHPRWNLWRAREAKLRADVASLYGEELVPVLSREPSSAFVADGSEVTVRRGTPLGALAG